MGRVHNELLEQLYMICIVGSKKVKDNSNYCKKHSSAASRSKEAEWPDCDDYEDFEEFMDDWDGHMPDGSDAEDYWDNW